MSINGFDAKKDQEITPLSTSVSFLSNMTACGDVGDNIVALSGKMKSDSDFPAPPSSNGAAGAFRTDSGNTASITMTSENSSKNKEDNSSSHSKKTVLNSFKNVDVLHENKVIARFHSQTECAAYLRATPEAVSYHCSKGGGTCNGLVIRPSLSSLEPLSYGLFEGADKHRPKEQPRISKEISKILKDWMLSPEHVDFPYPNEIEIQEFVKQTGIKRSQLKHWFANARKRIWKPYVAESNPATAKTRKKKSTRIKNMGLKPGSDGHLLNNTTASMGKILSNNILQTQFQNYGPVCPEADGRAFGPSEFGCENVKLDFLRNNSDWDRLGQDSFFGSYPTGFPGMGFNNGEEMTMFNGMNATLDRPNDGAHILRQDEEDGEPSSESRRSMAVFKQQVAAMAMEEANNSFQDTEAAYARVKELYALSTYEKPEEEDPMVIDANEDAKRCQSVAVFKLKVSQRANEEAARAYAIFQSGGDTAL